MPATLPRIAQGLAPGLRFWLGTHQPSWLEHAAVPLFVSDTRLRGRKRLPRAIAPWACDSGGFTMLQQQGRWTVTPEEYVDRLRRYAAEITQMSFCAPQDWMCEPKIRTGGTAGRVRFVGTHLSVKEHQHRTVENLLRLRELAPELPIIPVLQGYEIGEYVHCAELYARAGVDLTAEPLVGLGSVCRRQATQQIAQLAAIFAGAGMALHGFGVKTGGLAAYGEHLVSSDSQAWSDAGRWVAGCTPTHKRENNCLPFALAWRRRVLDRAAGPAQLTLPLPLLSVQTQITPQHRQGVIVDPRDWEDPE